MGYPKQPATQAEADEVARGLRLHLEARLCSACLQSHVRPEFNLSQRVKICRSLGHCAIDLGAIEANANGCANPKAGWAKTHLDLVAEIRRLQALLVENAMGVDQ